MVVKNIEKSKAYYVVNKLVERMKSSNLNSKIIIYSFA